VNLYLSHEKIKALLKTSKKKKGEIAMDMKVEPATLSCLLRRISKRQPVSFWSASRLSASLGASLKEIRGRAPKEKFDDEKNY